MAQRSKGRPSKFTPEIRKAIIDGITAGLTYKHICQIVDVDYDTFNEWRKKGAGLSDRDEAGYFDFSEGLRKAETNASTTMMALVRKAAVDDWRAAAWWLERRYPDEYGRQRVEVTGKDGGPIAVKSYQSFTPDEWDKDDSSTNDH